MKIKLLCISLFAVACSIETGPEDINSSTLSGTVGGQSWTFVAGHTDAFLSEGEDDFFATLHATQFTTCGFSEPSGPHLIVAVPKQIGDYDMGFSRNMTFVDGDDNLIAFEGRIIVDSVTPTRVTGGLYGFYDGFNEVNGRFDIVVCED